MLNKQCNTNFNKNIFLQSFKTTKNTFSAIQEWLQDHTVPGCPGKLLSVLAGLVQEKMGGSSGAVGFTLTLCLPPKERDRQSILFISISVVQPVFDCSSWTSDCRPEQHCGLG